MIKTIRKMVYPECTDFFKFRKILARGMPCSYHHIPLLNIPILLRRGFIKIIHGLIKKGLKFLSFWFLFPPVIIVKLIP
jgi:hypothetical protein